MDIITSKKSHLFGGLLGFTGAYLLAPAALAQNAGAAPAASDQLTEVIVTAEKYSENMEKAPVAVTAITATELKEQGTFTTTDLSGVIPNFTAAPNSQGSTVALRGVVTTAQGPVSGAEVSYNQDGVTLLQKFSAFQGMYDVNRIEVLRGPQGTLYGADANVGAINVLTNDPDLTAASGSASVGLGNYSAQSATGVLNMPLSSTFGVRLAVDQENHSGYTTLTTNESKFNDEDFLGVRLKALWKPTDNFSALLTYEQSHNGGAGGGGAGSGAPLGLYNVQMGTTPYSYEAMPSRQAQDWPIESVTLNLDWQLPWFDVNFIGNGHWQDWYESNPETVYGPDATYCMNTTPASVNCHNPQINDTNDRQTSTELRLSKQLTSVRWLVGLYHVLDSTYFQQLVEPSPSNVNQWTDSISSLADEESALYGTLTWNLTDQLSLVGGLRYQRDRKSSISNQYAAAVGNISITNNYCIACTPTRAPNIGSGEWDKVQWHYGANYNLTPDTLLFASVASGYKSGGFNAGTAVAFNPQLNYGPEDLIDYELGWKSQFWDHRAQVNVDAFYMHYTGYQITTSIIASTGLYQTVTLNSGVAAIKGIELESTFLLTPEDKLTFNATALRAVFTDFNLPFGDGYCAVGSICDTNYTGNILPYAPATTERLGYEHTFALNDRDSLVAHADSSFSSHYYLDYHDYTYVAQDAYTRTNAWLTWRRHDDNKVFSAQLFVRNIENKAILAGGQADNAAPGRDYVDYGKNGYYLAPRTFGIELSASL